MQTVLFLPELQLRIFRQLKSPSHQRLAVLTCTQWREAALDVLWGDNTISIWALTRILDRVREWGQTDIGNMERVYRLTRRIKSIDDSKMDNIHPRDLPPGRISPIIPDAESLLDLQRYSSDEMIFPRLESLSLTGLIHQVPVLWHFRPLFPPSLKVMHLAYSGLRRYPEDFQQISDELAGLSNSLTGTMPNLHEIRMKVEGEQVDLESFGHFLMSLPSLKILRLKEGLEPVMGEVSKIVTLEEVEYSMAFKNVTEYSDGCFPNLRRMDLKLYDSWDQLGRLIQCIQPGKLVDVSISHDGDVGGARDSMYNCIHSLHRHAEHLTKLFLMSYSDWTFEVVDLQLLSRFTNLEELSITHVGNQLKIGDDDLDALTRGMQRMHRLNLNGNTFNKLVRGSANSHLTPRCLPVLARNCPLLEGLGVRLNFTIDILGQEALIKSLKPGDIFHHLYRINVVQSDILAEGETGVDPMLHIAKLIDAITPADVEVASGYWPASTSYQMGMPDWDAPWRGLPVLVAQLRQARSGQ